MSALCPDLNRAILLLAPEHAARPDAPSTLAELRLAHAASPILPVYDGFSEATIFGDPKVNHAFRAWHDAVHLAGSFSFDEVGERAACAAQIESLLRAFPLTPGRVLAIIRAEIIGETEYNKVHGYFPVDQVGFVRAYLENPEAALCGGF